jgi:hypothetical protein
MSVGPRLRYHQAAFDLLGIAPRARPDADAALDAREKALGVVLPPSVREVYGLNAAPELLRTLSPDDRQARLDGLKAAKTYDEFEGWKTTPDDLAAAEQWYTILPEAGEGASTRHGYGAEPLLQVGVSGPGTCRWAVRLDGSDDPEVLVEDVDADVWRRAAEHYSTFLLARAWDRQPAALHGRLGASSPSAEAVGLLRDRFREGPRTFGWPGDWQLRFSDGDVRLRIAKHSDCDWADWTLAGSSRAALEAFVRRLAPLTGLSGRIEEWDVSATRHAPDGPPGEVSDGDRH